MQETTYGGPVPINVVLIMITILQDAPWCFYKSMNVHGLRAIAGPPSATKSMNVYGDAKSELSRNWWHGYAQALRRAAAGKVHVQ